MSMSCYLGVLCFVRGASFWELALSFVLQTIIGVCTAAYYLGSYKPRVAWWWLYSMVFFDVATVLPDSLTDAQQITIAVAATLVMAILTWHWRGLTIEAAAVVKAKYTAVTTQDPPHWELSDEELQYLYEQRRRESLHILEPLEDDDRTPVSL